MKDEQKALTNSDKMNADLADKLNSLTERNWLFIKYIRKNVPIKEAYKLAGYTSKVPSAPYTLMHSLRDKIELITDIEGFNRLKYKAELEKLLSIPLAHTKKDVTVSEKLRILKEMRNSLPEMKDMQRPQYTQIVINRYGTEPKSVEKSAGGENAGGAVIDAEIIEGEGR